MSQSIHPHLMKWSFMSLFKPKIQQSSWISLWPIFPTPDLSGSPMSFPFKIHPAISLHFHGLCTSLSHCPVSTGPAVNFQIVSLPYGDTLHHDNPFSSLQPVATLPQTQSFLLPWAWNPPLCSDLQPHPPNPTSPPRPPTPPRLSPIIVFHSPWPSFYC